MAVQIKIYPDAGDTYQVTLNVPAYASDINTYIDNWIDANLKFVEHYEIINGLYATL